MPDFEKYQGKIPCFYCVSHGTAKGKRFRFFLYFCLHLLSSSTDSLLLFSSSIQFQNVSFPFPQPLAEQKQLESRIGFRRPIVREGRAPKLVLCSVEASVWPYRWSRFESWQGQPGAKSYLVSFCLVFSLPVISPRRYLLFQMAKMLVMLKKIKDACVTSEAFISVLTYATFQCKIQIQFPWKMCKCIYSIQWGLSTCCIGTSN